MVTLSRSIRVFSDGSYKVDMPSLGEIWTLKSRKEAGEPVELEVGNFSAVTLFADPKGITGGQACWAKLGAAEIAWIKRLNPEPEYKPWRWACKVTNGGLYETVGGVDPELATSILWFRITLHSPDGVDLAHRNQVRVLEYSPDHLFCRVASIPKDSDYSRYEQFPYFIPYAYLINIDNTTNNTALFRMPLFDPASGFQSSLGGTGLWLKTKWLHSRV